jgi:hypothetical protein
MTVTYLVAINIDDPSEVEGLALEIDDILTDQGIDVTSVAPWARPTMGEPKPLPPMF